MYTTELVNAITGEVLASRPMKHRSLGTARRSTKYYARRRLIGGLSREDADYHTQMVIKDASTGEEVERHVLLEVRTVDMAVAHKAVGFEVLGQWVSARRLEWFSLDKDRARALAECTYPKGVQDV